MIHLKSLSKIVFFIALLALSNSLVVHPATEVQKNHASHAQEDCGDESQCCFICHSMHHQGIVSSSVKDSYVLAVSNSLSHLAIHFHLNPPLKSVFRPPLAS